ncbi:actin-related protein 2/3 complex subunit 4-like [Sturnira hondurensis]|uniref:actin-related protein 2/3 complex subunit 4-like n=1 Tax=Sturnira hondurensis TaxID=192404 RepID=UPI0018798C16|nr:actin-related protein 2/3 complex subunit 4-like [Sturnira hondurensis]
MGKENEKVFGVARIQAMAWSQALISGGADLKVKYSEAHEIEILCHKMMVRFVMMQAENFFIPWGKPLEECEVGFLIKSYAEQMHKHKLVDFVIHFTEEMDKEISEMKLLVDVHTRIVTEEFLRNF